MRTLIAIPCMENIPTITVKSLLSLQCEDVEYSFTMNSLVYDARNLLAQKACENGFDRILWIDSDMVFPSYVLQQFMQDDKDIVAGLYFRRSYPFTPVAFSELRRENGILRMKDLEEWPNDLFEVDGVGFGCVLMKTDCLFDIAGKEGGVWFTPTNDAGEDAAFCLRAKEYGYEIWVDPTVKLGHVGQTVITEGVYRRRKT